MTTTDAKLTDGFHLMVDALKLNGVSTIYGVVGRVVGRRHSLTSVTA